MRSRQARSPQTAIWRAPIAAWEAAAKADPKNVDLLVKLTRANYFLADGYLRANDKEYLKYTDIGVKWGEKAMQAVSPEFDASGENLHLLAGEHASHFFIHWLDLAAPLAIGGLWLWMFFGELRQRPLMATGDPYLRESLETAGGGH